MCRYSKAQASLTSSLAALGGKIDDLQRRMSQQVVFSLETNVPSHARVLQSAVSPHVHLLLGVAAIALCLLAMYSDRQRILRIDPGAGSRPHTSIASALMRPGCRHFLNWVVRASACVHACTNEQVIGEMLSTENAQAFLNLDSLAMQAAREQQMRNFPPPQPMYGMDPRGGYGGGMPPPRPFEEPMVTQADVAAALKQQSRIKVRACWASLLLPRRKVGKG